MAKRFFFVCAGLFLLALSWHLGARSVGAQPGTGPLDGAMPLGIDGSNYVYVMTPNFDVYSRQVGVGHLLGSSPTFSGNFWDGATPADRHSLGQLKQRFDNGGGQ